MGRRLEISVYYKFPGAQIDTNKFYANTGLYLGGGDRTPLH
jgi:hypothetical protein